MIEHRVLTKDEVNRLIKEAPESEVRNLIRIAKKDGKGAYEFLQKHKKEESGIVSKGRPIYMAILSKNNELWTVVNSDVKEQFSLFKISKRTVNNWKKKYGMVTAVMEKTNKKNIEWTKKIGFVVGGETKDLIAFILT